MHNEAFRKACLSATLAVAWAGSSSPAVADTPGATETVYIRTNFYHSIAVAKFVAIRDLTWIGFEMGAVPAGESYRSIGISLGSGSSGSGGMSYNMVVGHGLGSGSLPTEFIGMGLHDPNQGLGVPFETLFPGVKESDALAGLQGTSSDGGLALNQVLDSIVANPNMNLGINSPIPDTMLHFSDGTLLGTIEASFTPIPEPAFGLFCVGAMGFGVLRPRRGNAA